MDPLHADLKHHQLLLQTNSLIHVSCTGAGPDLQRRIWGSPGCSPYFAGFFTPYRRTQTHSFLGHPPEDSYCEPEVAYDMAMASYIQASEVAVEEDTSKNPIGLGISAAVASEKLPRGEHRAHLVVITKDVIRYLWLPLQKGAGYEARAEHDKAIAEVAMQLLIGALDGSLPSYRTDEETALERFYLYPIFYPNGTRRPAKQRERSIYLPATLNPIHDGHRSQCQAAEDLNLGKGRVCYLVSSVSPHKGRLTVQEMLYKAGMIQAERWRQDSRPVEFTRDEPLFLDKARSRPASTFIMGADAMESMLDPKWGPAIEPMLQELSQLGTQFLVMGRYNKVKGIWKTCKDIEVPYKYRSLFQHLEGRVDISSSELRGDA